MLHGSLFVEKVLSSNSLWVVVVTDDEEKCGKQCEEYAEIMSKASASSGGLLKVGFLRAAGSVRVSPNPEDEEMVVMTLYNISQVPTMLLWTPGGRRDEASPLIIPGQMADAMMREGAKRFFNSLAQFMPSLVTAPLRTPGFPSFFPEEDPGRFSPVVLLHNNPKPSPLLKMLSLEFSGLANFALVPGGDEAALAAWGVSNSSLPQLFVGPRGFRLPASAAPPASEKKPSGKKGAAAKASAGGGPYIPPPQSFKGWKAFPSSPQYPMNFASLKKWLTSILPAPTLPQLATQADLERALKASGLLFLAILPSSPEARSPSLSMLARVLGSSEFVIPDYESIQLNQQSSFVASRPYMTWAWIDGGAQNEFVSAFSGAATPGLLAYNSRKGVYSIMKGSLTEANVKEFVMALVIPLTPQQVARGQLSGVTRPEIPREKIDKLPQLANHPRDL